MSVVIRPFSPFLCDVTECGFSTKARGAHSPPPRSPPCSLTPQLSVRVPLPSPSPLGGPGVSPPPCQRHPHLMTFPGLPKWHFYVQVRQLIHSPNFRGLGSVRDDRGATRCQLSLLCVLKPQKPAGAKPGCGGERREMRSWCRVMGCRWLSLERPRRVRGPRRIGFLFPEACRTPWPTGDLALKETEPVPPGSPPLGQLPI